MSYLRNAELASSVVIGAATLGDPSEKVDLFKTVLEGAYHPELAGVNIPRLKASSAVIAHTEPIPSDGRFFANAAELAMYAQLYDAFVEKRTIVDGLLWQTNLSAPGNALRFAAALYAMERSFSQGEGNFFGIIHNWLYRERSTETLRALHRLGICREVWGPYAPAFYPPMDDNRLPWKRETAAGGVN